MRELMLTCLAEILLVFRRNNITVSFENSMPPYEKIDNYVLYVVGNKTWQKWALFKCPCGCNDVITLSLMSSHYPKWRFYIDRLNRVTLSPSVWKKDGCKSHFFVRKNKIMWVDDD